MEEWGSLGGRRSYEAEQQDKEVQNCRVWRIAARVKCKIWKIEAKAGEDRGRSGGA